MTTMNKYDLVISGHGNSAGGTFERVQISGKGEIHGDIECTSFQCDGLGEISGNMKTGTGRVNGNTSITGTIEAGKFTINGHSNIGGNANVNNLEIQGWCGIKGNIVSEKVVLRGIVKTQGDCTAETFVSEGTFNITGLLNADTIEIELYAGCRARELGGETITVRRHNSSGLKKIIQSILPGLNIAPGLETDTIEGDYIYLEYTRANAVRGTKVTLGPGCEINLVEYKDQFTQDKGSQVRESKKV